MDSRHSGHTFEVLQPEGVLHGAAARIQREDEDSSRIHTRLMVCC